MDSRWEKLIFREWHHAHFGYVTKLFLQSKFQNKENKHMKKCHFSANLVFFSSATDSENKIIQILHWKVQKKNILTELHH